MLRKIRGLLLIIFAVWLMLLATGWDLPYQFSIKIIQWFRDNTYYSAASAFIVLILGSSLIWDRRFSRRKIQLQKMEVGEVRITLAAIEDIIEQSISGLRGLSEIRTRIKQETEGLEIKFYCRLDDGRDLNSMSGKIQERISQDIEKYAGIKVKEVKVLAKLKNVGR